MFYCNNRSNIEIHSQKMIKNSSNPHNSTIMYRKCSKTKRLNVSYGKINIFATNPLMKSKMIKSNIHHFWIGKLNSKISTELELKIKLLMRDLVGSIIIQKIQIHHQLI